jgi:hypothetical protein
MQPRFRAFELKEENSMKKLFAILTVIAAFAPLASASHAACVASGEISRVSVNPGSTFSSFYVITSTPAQPSYLYGTDDAKVVNAALAAQASHMTVQVTGTVASCPTQTGGVIHGGTVVSFTTSP